MLHEATQRRIAHNMAAFEEFAKLYAFYVPQGLVPAPPTPDAAVSTAAADAHAVQSALAELVATRRALLTVRLHPFGCAAKYHWHESGIMHCWDAMMTNYRHAPTMPGCGSATVCSRPSCRHTAVCPRPRSVCLTSWQPRKTSDRSSRQLVHWPAAWRHAWSLRSRCFGRGWMQGGGGGAVPPTRKCFEGKQPGHRSLCSSSTSWESSWRRKRCRVVRRWFGSTHTGKQRYLSYMVCWW